MSGLYAIHLDGAERSLSYWSDTSAARLMLSQPEPFQREPAAADVIYMSGITMGVLSACDAGHMIDWVSSNRRPAALVTFDPKIRTRRWSDAEVKDTTLSKLAAVSDLVLPSFEDEALIFGDAAP